MTNNVIAKFFCINRQITSEYVKMIIIMSSVQLSSGIFWIISDNVDFHDYKFLEFIIPCDIKGNPVNIPSIPFNSKNNNNYNHKKILIGIK